MNTRIGALVVLFIVSLLGQLWLSKTLSGHLVLELAVIVALGAIAVITLLGAAMSASWANGLGVLFFAGSAANTALIYFSGREAFLEFIILLGWCVVGLIFTAMQSGSVNASLRPYGGSANLNLENIMPAPRRSARRRVARKAKRSKSRRK